jgi:Protein of unknown function (DUF1203)
MAWACWLSSWCALERAIEKLFANPNAEYLHVHFAAPGC